MPVAKSYQSLATFGEPFEENKKMYITVITSRGAHKKVRWYTDAEYAKLYPAEGASTVSQTKPLKPLKKVLGFSKGYITIFKGDTYPLLDWFRESAARYHNFFGWYFTSEDELPQLPAGITPIQLRWEDVCVPGEDYLKGEASIREVIDSLIYEPSNSTWQGQVGERIDRILTVTKITELEGGYYGPSTFFLFLDEVGNEYCWTTASKKLELGKTYEIRGSIKALQTYKGKQQTVLTRCRVG